MPAPTPPPGRLLSIPEVCKRLGVSRLFVYGLIGVLPNTTAELAHVRTGKTYKLFEADVDAWIARQTVNAGLRTGHPAGHTSRTADAELASVVAAVVARAVAAALRV